MQFFNFGNNETYQFFQWVTESGHVDVQHLIANAKAQMAADEQASGEDDDCDLSDYLESQLNEILYDTTGMHPDDGEGAEVFGGHDDLASLLVNMLVKLGMLRINFYTVAEAILIKEGWEPEKEDAESAPADGQHDQLKTSS